MAGDYKTWSERGDSGSLATFRFCDTCGATVAYTNEGMVGVIAIAVGAFADPDFPPPQYSVYDNRMHKWVAIIGEDIEHLE